MTRRFDPRGHRSRELRERWYEDDDESERDARDLFQREVHFARTTGDPRWGTGGMPVEESPPGRHHARPAPEWEPRRSYREHREPAEPPSAPYADRETSWPGPYVGRGPRGYRRSDERILEDVCERFTEHGHLDPGDVEVTVRGGEVVLSGTVATRAEKRLAEDIADLVFGVVEVHNRLRVQRPGDAARTPPGPSVADGALER